MAAANEEESSDKTTVARSFLNVGASSNNTDLFDETIGSYRDSHNMTQVTDLDNGTNSARVFGTDLGLDR